jgi:hypothetical protein
VCFAESHGQTQGETFSALSVIFGQKIVGILPKNRVLTLFLLRSKCRFEERTTAVAVSCA